TTGVSQWKANSKPTFSRIGKRSLEGTEIPPALAGWFFILCFSPIGAASADVISCTNGLREDGVTACDKCGDYCDWAFDEQSKKLSVSGSGDMYDFYMILDPGPWKWYNTAPWKDFAGDITSLDVKGLSYIGRGAFGGTLNNLTSVSFDDKLEIIGYQAFDGANLSNLKLPDSLKRIDSWAFSGNLNLASVEIPDSLEYIGGGAFWDSNVSSLTLPNGADISIEYPFGFRHLSDMQIICRGSEENCNNLKEKLAHYCTNTNGVDCNDETYQVDLSGKFSLANKNNCNSATYYWDGLSCKKEGINGERTCVSGFRKNDVYCARVIYTLEEAAKLSKKTGNTFRIKYK
ncbi:MAG: leucine-rich repeat domain-containing protein, partial [Alphaproteobacteria bacterium]|nr:leucine-rich repeat domain-containing protein [Alphaproteobacteria bacterium]